MTNNPGGVDSTPTSVRAQCDAKLVELGLTIQDVEWLKIEFDLQVDAWKHYTTDPICDYQTLVDLMLRNHSKRAQLVKFIRYCGESWPHHGSLANLQHSVKRMLTYPRQAMFAGSGPG